MDIIFNTIIILLRLFISIYKYIYYMVAVSQSVFNRHVLGPISSLGNDREIVFFENGK